MIERLKPFRSQKFSGHAWLGMVPEHWEITSLGSLSRPRSVRGRPDLPLLSVVREKGVIPRSSMSDDENHNFVPDDLSNYKVVRRGDLVINKMKAWQGSLGISAHDGVVSPAYFVFEFGMANLQFGHALLRSKPYVAFWGQSSDGVRIGQWDLSLVGMKRIPILVPPAEEQAAIVRFLDHAERRIRRYIKAKRRLIALLNEQKQAIIHRAVTRVLDPNVRLKPSGIDSLGDVPEHWDARPFGHLARVVRGSSPRPAGDPRFFHGDDIPWVTVGEVTKDDSPFLSASETRLTALGRQHSVVFPNGTLLLTNSGATLGVPKILTLDACANDGIVAFLKLDPVLDPLFAYYFLSAQTVRLREEMKQGGTQPNLNTSMVKQIVCPLPSLQEQHRIVDRLNSLAINMVAAVKTATEEIQLVQEYRTRLVADVVTGKLDVREAAARLPDEADEYDAPDEAEVLAESAEQADDADLEAMPEEVEA